MTTEFGIRPRPKANVLLRIALFAWAGYSLWLALLASFEISMAGFPDGYITPYDTTTRLPLEIFAWLTLAQAIYFLWRGLRGKRLGLAAMVLQVALAAVLAVAPLRLIQLCPQWNLCSQAYQSITGSFPDDGTGG